jgi:hypothetical protein
LTLAVVRDLREVRAPVGPEKLAGFETDVLAGFVLARAAAGLSDGTISSDMLHLEQVRAWFGPGSAGRCGRFPFSYLTRELGVRCRQGRLKWPPAAGIIRGHGRDGTYRDEVDDLLDGGERDAGWDADNEYKWVW